MTDTSAGPGNAVCYVTWLEIGVFNQTAVAGTSVNTMQVAIHEATGVIEMRLGAMQVSTATLGITGWSPGRVGTVASMHPGPRDLSHELPLVTQADGAVHALTHNVMSRPILGSPFTMQSFNQPTGAVLGATLISFGAQQPALPLPQLASGCGVSLALAGATTYEVYVGPTGTVSATPLTFPSLPLFMGVPVYTQYAAFDGAGLVYTSNGLELTAGLN
jgi:hypothetical protein